jgi:hypothetical protein
MQRGEMQRGEEHSGEEHSGEEHSGEEHSGDVKAEACWTDDEPGVAEARVDMSRALGRARRRWLTTLLIATALTGALVYQRVMHVPTFDASIVVRVTEREFDETTKPPVSRELNADIQDAFLGRSTLLALIEELDLYPDKMTPDPTLALEAMRDDLEVHVVQNYFDPERDTGLAARSARVVIAYRGRSPDHALALVRSLAQRFSDEKSQRRRAASQAATFRAELQQSQLHAQMRALAEKHAALSQLAETSALAVVQLRRVAEESLALQIELDGASDENVRSQLRSNFEALQMGMQFEIVDGGRRPVPLLSREQSIVLTGAIGFALLLPLSMLGVGMLTARIDDERDIVRLGLRAMGRWPWPNPKSAPRASS